MTKLVPLEAVLLDLDGTLVDSIADLADAANAMREALGRPALPLEVITTFVGKGADHLVRQTLLADTQVPPPDDAYVAQAHAEFARQYTRTNGCKTTIYPGVIEGLEIFRKLGIRLAVVTNKPEKFTLDLLKQTGLMPYMDAVVSGDTCERRKPDPQPVLHTCELLGVAPANALFVGDSMNDALAARAAGCPVLAVPYGYREGLDIDKLPVDGIVGTIVEATEWARQRFTWTET